MVDFIYHTRNTNDRIRWWVEELCSMWGSSCFISSGDETRLWVVLSDGERVEIDDFGDNALEFRKIIERAVG